MHGIQKTSNSVSGRIRAFFDANPEETLSADDAAIKFNTFRHEATRRMSALARAGLLARHKEGRTVIYSKAGTQ